MAIVRCGLCTPSEPIKSIEIEAVLRSASDAASVGGLSRPCEKMRGEWANHIVCTDKMDIPKAENDVLYKLQTSSFGTLPTAGRYFFSTRHSRLERKSIDHCLTETTYWKVTGFQFVAFVQTPFWRNFTTWRINVLAIQKFVCWLTATKSFCPMVIGISLWKPALWCPTLPT